MRHASVVRAAAELGVSASAVSHALGRLRRALDDELFIVTASGLSPTPRARSAAPAITDALIRLRGAFSQSFVPDTAIATFRIAASDYVTMTAIPRLAARLRAAAPRIDLRIFPLQRLDLVTSLDEARIDLAIGWFATLPSRMRRLTVMHDEEAIIVRNGHPLLERTPTRERLLEWPHVVVELTGTGENAPGGFFDDRGVFRRVWLERLLTDAAGGGQPGRAAVTVPHLSGVIPIVERTDLIGTLPARLALEGRDQGRVTMLDLPYEPLRVAVEAVLPVRSSHEPAMAWLLSQLGAPPQTPPGVAPPDPPGLRGGP